MAANMSQMVPNGQMMMLQAQQQQQHQQRQQQQPGRMQGMTAAINHSLLQSMAMAPVGSWQSSYSPNERYGKVMNLLSNMSLAAQDPQSVQKACAAALEIEKTYFLQAPDRQTYDHMITQKVQELVQRRQNNAAELQKQVDADAARQAQLQRQQQQMLLNQMAARGLGQPAQHGFQPIPNQFSTIPQQPQQMSMSPGMGMGMGMGMGGPAMLQNRPEQRQFPMQTGQPRPPGVIPKDMSQLNPQEKQLVNEMALRLMNQTPEPAKHQYRQMMQQKLNPAQFAEFTASGRDPAFIYFQSMAMETLQKRAQAQRAAAMMQRSGMPANVMPHAGPPQGQINPAFINALGQQAIMQDGQMFPQNLESIRNEQQMGFLAQEAGQMVVPASAAPGRNATPGAMTGLPAQPTPGSQQGQNQTPRPPQVQPPFGIPPAKMDPATAQAQAQSAARAVGRTMQGQSGAIAAPTATSQSPALSSLNTPLRQPPLPMGQPNGQPINQGNPQMGANLNPHFSHQNNTRPPSLSGTMANAAMAGMQNITPGSLPDNAMRELMAKWERHRPPANLGLQTPKQGQVPGAPGQLQAGPMTGPNQAAMMNPIQKGNVMIPPTAQQSADKARLMAYIQSPQGQATMNSMDIPPDILNRLRATGPLPGEIRKWGHFKQFIQANPTVPQASLLNNLLPFQVAQFKSIWDKKRSAGIAGVPQPPNAPGAQVQLQQNQPGLPPGYTYPIFQVTPQDMEAFRKHPKVATMSDESLYEFIKRAKRDNFYKRSWEAYNAQNQGNANPPAGGQKTTPQIPQIPVTQPGSVTPTQQQNLRQNAQQQAAQMKPPGVPAADAVTTAASATPNNVRPPPNPSPAPAPKSLKRPSPDDSNEASSQPSSAMQRASSQLEVRPPTAAQKLSPEQIAKLPPDQKAAAMRKQVQQGQQEYAYEISRLKEIQRQALQGHQQQPGVEIAMSGSELQETRHRIAKARGNMDMLRGQGILQWYRLTKDDARATMFFKVRFKIVSQFLDGEKMTQMRPSLTISKDELDQFISMTDGMLRELPIALKANQGAAGSAQPGNQRPSQPAPAAAPLSAANLEKQTQALKQAQNRTIPKTAQPPAAPTTAQPPFQFGAHKTPARNPEYFSEQRITPANLVLPPRKKAKTAAAQKSPPVTQTQAAGPSSPQTKAPSPTVGRKAEPVKAPPKLVCPEPGCEMNSMGFQSEEALNAHREEEHVKPYENPYGFLQEQITSALGLDAQGQPKPAQQLNSQEPAALAAPPMSASVSKQGQTPRSKPESAATPMSREASMRRQGSAAGAKAGEVVGTPGRNATPRVGNGRPPAGKQEIPAPQATVTEDPWSNSTIDPQNLFAPLGKALDYVNGNVMADFGTYRSSTPNDTPESSKDSGTSEPTSDIPEGSTLDIDMSLLLDNDLLPDMDKINMEGLEGLDSDLFGAENLDYLLDDMVTDFSKPFQFDSSLYSMDPTA